MEKSLGRLKSAQPSLTPVSHAFPINCVPPTPWQWVWPLGVTLFSWGSPMYARDIPGSKLLFVSLLLIFFTEDLSPELRRVEARWLFLPCRLSLHVPLSQLQWVSTHDRSWPIWTPLTLMLPKIIFKQFLVPHHFICILVCVFQRYGLSPLYKLMPLLCLNMNTDAGCHYYLASAHISFSFPLQFESVSKSGAFG